MFFSDNLGWPHDNIYIDLKLLSWQQGGGNGGGFSYERSTNPNLSVEFKNAIDIYVYPNPTTGFVRANQDIILQIRVYDFNGKQLLETDASSVDLGALKNGVYFLILFEVTLKIG